MSELIDKMNAALGWELRAINMYAHYSANVKGIHRLQLSPMFNTEMTESIDHAENATIENDGDGNYFLTFDGEVLKTPITHWAYFDSPSN